MAAERRPSDPVIVIGSGPCGAIAARELVLAGLPVVLLEAGRRPPAGLIVRAAGRTLVRYRAHGELATDRHVATGDPATEWYSSQAPGGLSNYWTAAVPRFAPDDFTDGARLDGRLAWPVTYEDLVPYYDVAEELLCVTGPSSGLPVLPRGITEYTATLPDDWQRLADGPLAGQLTSLPLARGRPWMVARRGSEFNSYHVIVRPLQRQPAFELRLGAHAVRLIGERGAITGAEYLDTASNQRVTVSGRAVVLAAGAIDSTRILLSSTSASQPGGLGNANGLLGRYLHDHPRDWWPAELAEPMTLLDHPAYLARALYADSAPLQCASATIGLESPRDRPKSMLGRKGRRIGVQVFGTMVPNEESTVSLSADQVDARGLPRVVLNIRYDDAAVGTLVAARQRFSQAFATAGNAPTVFPVDGFLPRPGSSVHYGGSVRMHADPRFGVLDEWNRLRDAPNVVVCDLSCFPTNPEKNPTLTAMALAARAARRLASDVG